MENKIRLLVLGNTGMLGSMISTVISNDNRFELYGTYNSISLSKLTSMRFKEYYFNAYNFSSNKLFEILNITQPDYIINCIGIIKPYCKDNDPSGVLKAIKVNALFPHELSKTVEHFNKKIKIIQIATDCVFDGKKGNYLESDLHNPIDVYGKSKSLGEVSSLNVLNIRCSIIGPELNGKLSLLEWFLNVNNNETINGFSHHFWNGITTLQFTNLCVDIMIHNKFQKLKNLSINTSIHYVINTTVSKYQLLNIFKQIFHKENIIEEIFVENEKIDRTIESIFLHHKLIPMQQAILELKDFLDKSSMYRKCRN
jgi:dTDP-4-dehydrorhamnose reductase